MTSEEAKASVGGALSQLWDATVAHLNEAKVTYAVLIAVGVGIWNFALRNAVEAWAGDVMLKQFQLAVEEPCFSNPSDSRHNPQSLACQREKEAAEERAQTKAIQDLAVRADKLEQLIAEDQIKRSQETNQILRALEGLQPQ